MSLFDEGRAILAQIAEGASEDITYTQAGEQPRTIRARIGERIFKTSDGAASVNVSARRFIVVLASLTRMPAKGDTITWRNRIYKLGCPDGGPVWRWHGNDGRCIAIYATDFGQAT